METRLNPKHQQDCQLAYITEEQAKANDYGCTCKGVINMPDWFAEYLRNLSTEQKHELGNWLYTHLDGSPVVINEMNQRLMEGNQHA